ncbi:MAG: HAMP domain-containing sensor histidine kinase [Pseudomonadota bacterium]
MITSDTSRSVAHDLRHLLCTIRLTAEMLENSEHDATVRRAQRIIRAVDNGTEICTGILSANRPETEAEPAPISIAFSVRDLLRDVAAGLHPPEGVVIRVRCPSDIEVDHDRASLFRAIFNLATNAVRAIEGHGGSQVTLCAQRLDGRLVLSVEDDGPGLEKTKGAAPSPITLGPKSEGLGLGLVKSLVAATGGTFRCAKTSDAGTTFRIVLPLGRPEPAPRHAPKTGVLAS